MGKPLPNYKSLKKYTVVPDSIQDSEVARWRYETNGAFAEKISNTVWQNGVGV